MAKHIFERPVNKPPYFQRLEVETGFSEEEVRLFTEIEELTNHPDFLSGVTDGSGYLRTFGLDYPVPYGYSLRGSREDVLRQVVQSRNFIVSNLDGIKRQTPYCEAVMEQILEKLNLIIGNKVV